MLRILLVLALGFFHEATASNGVCDWNGYSASDGSCVCSGYNAIAGIGSNEGGSSSVTISLPGYTCPKLIDKSNWRNSDTYDDWYSVITNKGAGTITVSRGGSDPSWGMDLQFECCANVCTCSAGTPAVATGSGGTLCQSANYASGYHDCSACSSGYHLNTPAAATSLSTCTTNTCTCANGNPTFWNGGGGNSCAANGDEDCYACISGYTLSTPPAANTRSTCVANTCTCANGNPTYWNGGGGNSCAANGDEDCYACSSGYTLSTPPAANTRSTCVANTCTCANGTPTYWNGEDASFCVANGEDCESCDAGYTLSAPAAEGTFSTCVANVCTCENGTPTSATGAGGELCETDEDEDCSTCDEDYDISETAAAGTLSTCAAPGACFHGDGTLLLESGATKKFSELALGERIKTTDGQGRFSFSPVLTLPHNNNTEPAAFVALTTETGKKVDMTSDHIIPKCDEEEVTAGELVVGDCVLTVDGKETLMEVSSTAKTGVFTAITRDKFLVVGGVVASSFSKDSDPAKPERDYKKYRLELAEKRERKLEVRMSKLKKRVEGAHAN